jgi:hypothetical protein
VFDGLDQRFASLYHYPLEKLRNANHKLVWLHSNAQASSSKVYGTAVYLFKNLGQMGPDFAVPTLGDLEKVTSAFISMSTDETGGVGCAPGDASVGGGGGVRVNDGASGAITPSFQDLKFSNERVSELMRGALRFLAEARTSTPSQVISRMLFYLADTVGTSLDRQHRDTLERQVGQAINDPNGLPSAGVRMSAGTSVPHTADHPHHLRLETQAMTGVVLSYREREDQLPWTKSRRIQRSMHYKMPLRPFQATVFIPNPTSDNMQYDTVPTALRRSCTPQSFPASPAMRNRVLTGFSNYTEDVLYRARDELRCSGQEEYRAKNATFNLGDAHRDVILSCGLHCASRDGQGLHRSVRATLPVQRGVPVYFEMYCVPCVPALEDDAMMVTSQNTSGFSASGTGSTNMAMTSDGASNRQQQQQQQSAHGINNARDGQTPDQQQLLAQARAAAHAQAHAHARAQAEVHAFEVAQQRSVSANALSRAASNAAAAAATAERMNGGGDNNNNNNNLPVPESLSSSNSLQQMHNQLRVGTDDAVRGLGRGGRVDAVAVGGASATPASAPAGIMAPSQSPALSPTSLASDLSKDPDVCIGLSTINFPLNFLVGSRRYSIGMASCGHLVAGPVWLRGFKGVTGTDASFRHGNVVGVLVQILEDECDLDEDDEPEMVTVLTNFFVDGEPVVGLPDRALEMRIPIDVDVYPTLSICSSFTKVFGHFSTEDIVYGTPEQLSPFVGQESVYALDGSLIYHESSLYPQHHHSGYTSASGDESDYDSL